jgi:hypothetical protein
MKITNNSLFFLYAIKHQSMPFRCASVRALNEHAKAKRNACANRELQHAFAGRHLKKKVGKVRMQFSTVSLA